jgi:hypothetical protein
LTLPEAVASKLAPPTIESKPLTEFADRRLEVLVSLLSAKRRGVFTAPKEVFDTRSARFKLMSSRLDKRIARAAARRLVAIRKLVLVPGDEAQLAAVSQRGIAEIQIKQLKFRGLGVDTKLNAADKMLPGTDTAAEVKVPTPKTLSLTVPSSEHLYDGKLFGEPLDVEADLTIEGVSFKVENEVRREVAPAVEIVSVEPSPYVTTPATSQKPLDFRITLKNHLNSEFKGLLRVSGQTLETGREITLRPDQTDTTNFVVRPLALSGQIQGSTLAVTVDLPVPKEPIAKRNVPLIYADALVVSGRKVGYLPSYDRTLERALAALGVDSKQLTVR